MSKIQSKNDTNSNENIYNEISQLKMWEKDNLYSIFETSFKIRKSCSMAFYLKL